jgi:prolyl 3-hydroxylase /prolyl 3,4-dihydroxylase
MSVNTYKFGCHLLNHDDVIGTRRVSYILYMPLPYEQAWQPEWGGALELYATRDHQDGVPEPEASPVKSIPPSWNQFVFFEVQPGKSFHSVEEVVVGKEEKDGRQRLSISGWFHAVQPDEKDFGIEPSPESKSSLEQLVSYFYANREHAINYSYYRPRAPSTTRLTRTLKIRPFRMSCCLKNISPSSLNS